MSVKGGVKLDHCGGEKVDRFMLPQSKRTDSSPARIARGSNTIVVVRGTSRYVTTTLLRAIRRLLKEVEIRLDRESAVDSLPALSNGRRN